MDAPSGGTLAGGCTEPPEEILWRAALPKDTSLSCVTCGGREVVEGWGWGVQFFCSKRHRVDLAEEEPSELLRSSLFRYLFNFSTLEWRTSMGREVSWL